MKNLACNRNASESEIELVTETAKSELVEAGIVPYKTCSDGEVPSRVFGALCYWSFRRAWYYWIAEGPGIPPHIAERFHAVHGKEVRVEGHCLCPSPLEYRYGFAISMYHIDTQAGLNAFAELLRSICTDPNAEGMK